MARVSSTKKLNKAKALPVPSLPMPEPNYNSAVGGGDFVLVNKGNVDYHTTVSELSTAVGKGLNLEQLIANINENHANIGDLETSLNEELNVDQARQDSWTGAGPATNTGATNRDLIAANAAAISRLQGALVYRGVGDFSQAAPAAHSADFYACDADNGSCSWPGLTGGVKENHYYAYNGDKSVWEDAGAHSLVVPDPGNGTLAFTTGNELTFAPTGGGFTANSAGGETYAVKVEFADGSGLAVGSGGLEVNIDDSVVDSKGDPSLIVDDNGISVNPDFISGVSGVEDAALTINKSSAATSGLTVTGGGFTANAAVDKDYAVAINVDGSVVDDNGKPSLIIDTDGISVNPDYISSVAPAASLDEVLKVGNSSTMAATVGAFSAASVASSGAVTAVGDNNNNTSSFLFKDISKLPTLTN